MRNLFGGDPHFNNVVLQLPLRSHLRDESKAPTAVTVNGNAKVVDGAAYFDGTGDYLTLADSDAFNLADLDFTIAAWIYIASAPTATSGLLGKQREVAAYGEYAFYINTSREIGFAATTGGESDSSWTLVSAVGTALAVPVGTWTHVAVCRAKTLFTLWVGGRLAGSATGSGAVTDFTGLLSVGSLKDGGSFPLTGYIKDVRITKGIARYTQNFIPPTFLPTHGVARLPYRVPIALPEAKRPPVLARRNEQGGDPHFNNVVLQLPLRSHLRDESRSQKTLTAVGDSKIVNGAVYFDGTGDRLDDLSGTNGEFRTGDLTVELYAYATARTGVHSLIATRVSETPNYFSIDFTTNNVVSVWTSGAVVSSPDNAITTNRWYHIAWTRKSGVSKLFIDGVFVAAAVDTRDYYAGWLGVGAMPNNYGNYFSGYIKDLRITKDVARYISNFTPPTYLPTHGVPAPFASVHPTPMLADAAHPPVIKQRSSDGDPHFNNVVLQLPLRSHLRDESKLQRAVTQVGGIVVNNESAYFDGTDNTLSLADSADWDFVNNDFTIEFEGFALTRGSTTDALIVGQAADFSGSTQAWAVCCNNTGSVYMLAGAGTGTWGVLSGCAMSVSANESRWQHYAFVRRGSWVGAFCNGRLIDDATWSGTVSVAKDLRIGSTTDYSNLTVLSGRLRNMRLMRGARYTSAGFIPPASLPTHGVDNSKIKVVHTGNVVVAPETGKKIVYLSAKDNLVAMDPFYNKVLYHVIANNGIIKELKGTTVTINAVSVSNTIKPLFAKSSMYFNSTQTCYLSIPAINFWSAPYTIDGWIYNINGSSAVIASAMIVGEGGYDWGLGINSSNQLNLYYWTGIQNNLTSSQIVPTNKWVHFAIHYSNGIFSAYINGKKYLWSYITPNPGTSNIKIGKSSGYSDTFNGYIYNIRVTKGIRYPGQFFAPEPPTMI